MNTGIFIVVPVTVKARDVSCARVKMAKAFRLSISDSSKWFFSRCFSRRSYSSGFWEK
jgi:hypothetical protein